MHGNTELGSDSTEMITNAAQSVEDTAGASAAAIRRRLRAARSAMTPQQRQQASTRICALLAQPGPRQWPVLVGRRGIVPQVIAAFWPLAEEPDLRTVLRQWVTQGYTVVLPDVVREASPLTFRRWQPEAPMQADRYGIPVPVGAPCVPDTLLVPTLGFTPHADRLGYGGGYYDRTLAALAESGATPLAIGVAFDCGRLEPIEHRPAPHDIALDAVLTEYGWHCPSPRSPANER
ncbi:MAG: 5-formyltetrahydrofolate cyclo-ligase [Pigmentiphaga sp.]